MDKVDIYLLDQLRNSQLLYTVNNLLSTRYLIILEEMQDVLVYLCSETIPSIPYQQLAKLKSKV